MNFDFGVYLLAITITGALVAAGLKIFGVFTLKALAPILAASTLVFAPVTFTVGTNVAKADLTNYNEWWNGKEKKAWVEITTCTPDGPCVHEYDCDPYQVPVTKTRSVSDGKGGTTTETYVDWETRWHECPYVSQEYSYYVSDTMDETYSFGSHLFPADPQTHLWRASHRSLPSVAAGVPDAWAAAKARIDGGKPEGTTKRHTYKNYVLAAQETVYRKYSDAIGQYLKDDLLPKLSSALTASPYFADKVYFVGSPQVERAAWQSEIQKFNGDFGGERQGDLHLVIVNAERVPDGDSYNNALEAYWQDKALGKDTLSKNGVVLIVGVQGNQVKWTNGFTGMPEGNEAVLQAFRSFTFSSLTPQEVFSQASPLRETLMVTPGYKRVEMKNYVYLEDSIKPGAGAHALMTLITVLITLAAGAGFVAAVGIERFAPSRPKPGSPPSSYLWEERYEDDLLRRHRRLGRRSERLTSARRRG